VLAILPRAENRTRVIRGRTWSGNGADLDIGKTKYFIAHYDVQRDVDCECDEVRSAAMKARNDENRTSVICDERITGRAINVAPWLQCEAHQLVRNELVSTETENREDVPMDCTVRPRVEPDSIVTLFEVDMSCVE